MTILIFIAVLVLLIVGHELGHFLVAKSVKMRVLEFGVGFPPKITGKKVGETEYTLNWIPFGGFVRIFGEDQKDIEDPVAFPNRPKIHQALVLFAGPFANVVLAFLLTFLALMIGTASLVDADTTHVTDKRVYVGQVLEGSPADTAGVKTGDVVLSVSRGDEEHAVTSPEDLSMYVGETESFMSLTVERGGELKTFTITPEAGLIEDSPEKKALGVATALVGTVSYPLHEALWRAVVKTGQDFVFVLVSLGTLLSGLFTFSADISQIAGPVGIASLTGEAASIGFGALLSFAALLSINLAIINLLPFPALDGGRLLFLGIETVSRRRIPLNIAQAVNGLGFALLILLMVAVTVGDISRLLG